MEYQHECQPHASIFLLIYQVMNDLFITSLYILVLCICLYCIFTGSEYLLQFLEWFWVLHTFVIVCGVVTL